MFARLRDSSQTIGQVPALPTVTAVDKTDVSPILKQTLTFTLSSSYTDTLLRTDLAVQLIGAKNYARDLYVMSVDNENKTFTVKFNGAPVGTYTFAVTSTSAS